MTILIQVLFFLINIAIARYQAYRFDKLQKRISHTMWLICYTVGTVTIYIPFKNWYLISAALLMHLPVFNTFLNYFRTPRRPFFYTHPDDPYGSIADRWWSDAYPAVFFFTTISFIVIQFYI